MKKLFNMSEKTNIKVSVVVAYISLFASGFIALFYSPFLLRSFGDRTYGLYSFSESLVSWLSFLSLALTSTYIRFATLAEKRGGPKGLSVMNGFYMLVFVILTALVLIFGLLTTLLLKIGIIPLSLYTDEEKNTIILLVFLCVLLSGMYLPFDFFNLFISYRSHFTWVRLGTLFVSVFTPLLVIPLVKIGWGIWILVGASIFTRLITGCCSVAFAFSKLKIRLSFPSKKEMKSNLKEVFVFSFFILINTIVSEADRNIAKTLLGLMAGSELVTMYSFGLQLNVYVTTMGQSITTTLSPRIHSLVADGKKNEVNSLFIKSSELTGFLIVYIFGGFVACGEDFVTAWLGAGHQQTYFVALVLIGLSTLPLAEGAGIEIQRAENLHKFRSLFLLGTMFLDILLTYLLLRFFPQEFQIFGCLIATAVSSVSGSWIATNIYYDKKMRLPIRHVISVFIEQMVIAGLAALLCYGTFSLFQIESSSKWLPVLLKALVFTIFYFSIFVTLKPETIKAVLSLFTKKKQSR